MSPASKVIFGIVLLLPPVSVTKPWALRKPLAVARIVYVPAEAVRVNVPLVLAAAEVTSVLVASYKLTVTGLPASTCPVTIPEPPGMEVDVGDPMGVERVAVGDPAGVEEVEVAVPTGVDCVAVGVIVGEMSHVKVETICPKTADSAA